MSPIPAEKISTDKKAPTWKHWVGAFRLRTLPLALASIILGSLLAWSDGQLRIDIAIGCVLTTLLLQILSNLANDYGDSIHGADSEQRQGPSRAVQAGHISATAMRKALYVFAGLSLLSGTTLLWLAFGTQGIMYLAGFLVLGLFAIWAAISYTNGKKPYGYAGLGDVFVFFFFGWVGVLGTYFLQTQQLQSILLLPATACGLLATGVLNVNNLRDIDSDRQAGKLSIPVRLGSENGKWYHFILLAGAVLSAVLFAALVEGNAWKWLFLLAVPLLGKHFVIVRKENTPALLDPQLRVLALSTLVFVVLLGAGQILAR